MPNRYTPFFLVTQRLTHTVSKGVIDRAVQVAVFTVVQDKAASLSFYSIHPIHIKLEDLHLFCPCVCLLVVWNYEIGSRENLLSG